MLDVFRRELSGIAARPLQVLSCKAKVGKGQRAVRQEILRVVYKLRIRLDGTEQDCVLLGAAPETAAFPGAELVSGLQGHPALAPFVVPALVLDELKLALCVFPLDPVLPALAELTGTRAPSLIAPHLAECRAGARLERVEHDLRHYKPFRRAVLRVTASFGGSRPTRTLYAKLFHDGRGAVLHREQSELWNETRGARALRMPEPLGYDAQRRMLLMAEADGLPHMIDWIKCVENDRPLPRGVDLQRLERCMELVADALAELQDTRIRPTTTRRFADEVARLAKNRVLLQGELGREHPDLTRRAAGLIGRLETLAPAHEELRPAHGGFRHKQVLGDDRGLTVIDWDGLCLADPAADAATFLLRLRRDPTRSPGHAPAMEHLASYFRDQFLARAPRVSPARLALYEGLALTDGLLRSFRRPRKGVDEHRQLLNLARAAGAELDRARRTRPA